MLLACDLESQDRTVSDESAIDLSQTAIVQTPEPPQISLIARMERALLLLAYFIELDGDVHLPMFEKFEAELDELRRKENARERARRLLVSYSREGGVKAIDCKNSSLSSSDGPLPYLGLPVR
jgi:hypothetical protein